MPYSIAVKDKQQSSCLLTVLPSAVIMCLSCTIYKILFAVKLWHKYLKPSSKQVHCWPGNPFTSVKYHYH